MAAGALWNSGLFAWTARRLLSGSRHTPRPPRSPLETGFFRDMTPISIDVGLNAATPSQ
jgi:hypothetical protein